MFSGVAVKVLSHSVIVRFSAFKPSMYLKFQEVKQYNTNILNTQSIPSNTVKDTNLHQKIKYVNTKLHQKTFDVLETVNNLFTPKGISRQMIGT